MRRIVRIAALAALILVLQFAVFNSFYGDL